MEGKTKERSAAEVASVITEYLDLMRIDLPEKAIMGKLKQFSSQVTRRVKGSADVRKDLVRSQTVDEFVGILDAWPNRAETFPRETRLEIEEMSL